MLGRRRRRRANIKPALGQRLVFAGLCPDLHYVSLYCQALIVDFLGQTHYTFLVSLLVSSSLLGIIVCYSNSYRRFVLFYS